MTTARDERVIRAAFADVRRHLQEAQAMGEDVDLDALVAEAVDAHGDEREVRGVLGPDRAQRDRVFPVVKVSVQGWIERGGLRDVRVPSPMSAAELRRRMR